MILAIVIVIFFVFVLSLIGYGWYKLLKLVRAGYLMGIWSKMEPVSNSNTGFNPNIRTINAPLLLEKHVPAICADVLPEDDFESALKAKVDEFLTQKQKKRYTGKTKHAPRGGGFKKQ